MLKSQERRKRRHKKIRSRIRGTSDKPRLCVFKSSKHIYAQLIDDDKGKTILAYNDSGIKKSKKETKVKTAFEVGKLIAKEALGKKMEKVVFDRGGNRYHGRIKALADGAREGGLKF
ncbi:MAG: 50S ribosomal protein L18 [Candidatus Nealsonbacteria bacterium]|nr:50S ribosomal protein L18 [Candidatus Nealsonbacteria bacterium]